ncbi:40S ribosomal protein S29-like [Eutrema salsugineum]|uniref:40S ribosomal protein S29-like n=1 Tax=Eutrema salsugineum TaxID=72664 RepID=UPI000CED18E7|nr:40S ribosomal protein S29-like [Eutrema salsugineum]
MGFSTIWNSQSKKYGTGSRTWRVFGNSEGLIRKYGLNCCRQYFCSNAKEIGFIKYR